MDPGGWYIAKAAGDQRAGPVTGDAFKKALLSGQIGADDQIWRDGMDGWEIAAPFLWFAERGAERAQPAAQPAAEPAREPMAEAKPRPAPHPPGGHPQGGHPQGGQPAGAGIGQLERPERKVVGKMLGHTVSITEPDLADFAGTDAEPYLAFRQKAAGKGGRAWLSWSWAAFFVPLAWLAYRKMFGLSFAVMTGGAALAALVFAVPAMAPVLGVAAFAFSLVMAMIAKRLVLVRADRAAQLADGLDLAPVKRAQLLAAEGGVSRAGGWAGAVLQVVVFGLVALPLAASYLKKLFSGMPI